MHKRLTEHYITTVGGNVLNLEPITGEVRRVVDDLLMNGRHATYVSDGKVKTKTIPPTSVLQRHASVRGYHGKKGQEEMPMGQGDSDEIVVGNARDPMRSPTNSR